MLAKAINAVGEGHAPELPRPLVRDGAMTTYAHEYAIPIPAGASLSSQESLHAFGHRAAEIVVESQSEKDRERAALQKIQDLFKEKVQ